MVFNNDGTYDSLSEGEMEALEQVAMHHQVNNEEEQVFCDEDSSPTLVVPKVLTLEYHQEEDQRCHIFHTKAGTNGRSVKVIIDGGSCHNLASEELCSKLQLVKKKSKDAISFIPRSASMDDPSRSSSMEEVVII